MPPLARSVWPLIQPAVRSGEEAHGRGDVLGRPETLERRHLRHAIDELGRLALEEQIGRRRPRCDGVDGHVAPAQLLGEDAGHRLDAGLGRRIDRVSGQQHADDAGREIDDAAARANVPGRLAHGVEAALQVDVDHAIERGVVRVGDVRQRHDAGVVDQHIDAAEGGNRLGKQATHVVRLAHVGLADGGAAARGVDAGGQRLGGRDAFGIVDHDGKAVAGESLGDGRADAARSAGDKRDLIVLSLGRRHVDAPTMELCTQCRLEHRKGGDHSTCRNSVLRGDELSLPACTRQDHVPSSLHPTRPYKEIEPWNTGVSAHLDLTCPY